MNLLLRRYTRSGYAPPWFYAAATIGFAAMAVWAIAQADWIVAAIATAMIPATFFGARVMRQLRDSAAASRREVAEMERRRDEHDA
jgi:hypothetical protein